MWHVLNALACWVFSCMMVINKKMDEFADAHDWVKEIEGLKKRIDEKNDKIQKVVKDLKSKDAIITDYEKEIKRLKAKLREVQSKVDEDKKILDRVLTKKDDLIDRTKYDLKTLDKAHKDLQADYAKLKESVKSFEREKEELKEVEKQRLLASEEETGRITV